jgi:hypothetical protein
VLPLQMDGWGFASWVLSGASSCLLATGDGTLSDEM